MAKHPGGRPIEYPQEDVLRAINEYIASTDQPLVKEFCLQYGISDERLDQLADINQEIFGAKKRLLAKQEVFLVKAGSANQINPTMAIFRLKQPVFGYTDKQDFQVSGNVTIKDDLPAD